MSGASEALLRDVLAGKDQEEVVRVFGVSNFDDGVRAAVRRIAPDVVTALLKAAKKGDAAAIRLLEKRLGLKLVKRIHLKR